tara:strand:- start:3442 stop:3969 length:528 start_codon:yes stop_codon:yes gene_type:complete
MTRIHVLSGPESSGKTTLASALASYYSAPLVPEQARTYLDSKKNSNPAFKYQQSDLLAIAKQQLAAEQSALSLKTEHIFCDTDLLVLIIWSEVRFGNCDTWIIEQFEKCISNNQRHYLLCDWQIPWEADALREHPEAREQLFRRYQKKMKEYGIIYTAVSGSTMQRFKQAYAAIA